MNNIGNGSVVKISKIQKRFVFAMAAIGFGLTLGSSVAQAQVQWLDRSIAIVQDDVILQSEFEARMKNAEEKIKNRPEGTARPPHKMVEDQVLNGLILESIQLQMADRRGIQINDDELNKAVEGIARQNNMSLAEFKVAVQKEGTSYLQAREQIRVEMLVSRVQQWTLRNQIAVSDQEVDSYLNSEQGQKRESTEYRVTHLLLVVPTGASVETLAKVELEAKQMALEIKQGTYFSEFARVAARGDFTLRNSDLGWRKTIEIPSLFAKQVPAMAEGEILGPIQSASGFHFIQLAEKRGAMVHVVDEVLARHILVSSNEVRTESDTEQLVQSLYQRIEKGEDFAELARQFSEDPGSTQEGGKLGWASLDSYVAEFAATAKGLAKNELSKPFKTQFGWHILQLLDRRNTDKSVQFQRDQIRRLIFNRKFEEEKNSWLRKIREEAYVEIVE